MPVPALPQQIHRYRVLSELGRGSMGRVFLAVDPNIDRRIALKVMMPERLDGEDGAELRQRFLQEARAAGGLSHPGIVMVYDADTDPETGCPYLAMELVAGRSLRSVLRAEGPLAVDRAVSLAVQVARALDYAHRHDVIHRDIKPANLLVDGEIVKVADFGIAKLLSRSLTLPGRILGSPYYMAPEQVRGQEVDGRADLFALGTVLYESLTGRVAFGGDSPAAVSHKILAVDPRPIELYNPEVPVSLRAVVGRALEKLPRDRFQTAAELAAALETVEAELALGSSGTWTGRRISSANGSATDTGSTEVRHPAVGQVQPQAVSPQVTRRDPVFRSSRLGILALLLVIAGVLVGRSFELQIPGLDRALFPFGNKEDGALLRSDAAPDVEPSSVSSLGAASAAEAAEQEAEPSALEFPPAPPSVQDPDLEPPAEPSPGQESSDSEGAATEDPLPAVAVAQHDPPPPKAVPKTHLEIVYENHLKLAYLSVWIDGDKALSVQLRRKNLLRRLTGQEHRWTIPVPVGRRSVEVHISGISKPLEAHRKSFQKFSVAEPRRLRVFLKPNAHQLSFVWEDR